MYTKVGAGEIPIETIAPLSAAVTPLLQTALDCYRLQYCVINLLDILQASLRSILQNVVFDMSPCNTHSMVQ